MPEIPATARKPRDRQKPAAQLEAENAVHHLDWRGLDLTFPSDSDSWPLEVLEHIEAGEIIGGIRSVLGDEQWAQVRALKPTIGEAKELFNEFAKLAGFDTPGN